MVSSGADESNDCVRIQALLPATLCDAVRATPAFAISDEIQVYTDDINKPGEFGLELHMNTTPVGISTAPYPGGSVSRHGFRLTPEFSYGLNEDFEAGLYLPTVRESDGSLSASGAKLRLKWLPVQARRGQRRLVSVASTSNSRASTSATRKCRSPAKCASSAAIARKTGWSASTRSSASTSHPAIATAAPTSRSRLKARARRAARASRSALEYYSAIGTLAHPLPSNLQENTLYLVIDFDRKPWALNFGVGRGLNGATDNWTVKAIVGVPF